MNIDNENLFFSKLKSGINLFTGAGFSVLPSPSGRILPKTSELLTDVCDKFGISASYSCDIERVAAILQRNYNSEFQDYLREKYRISEYNSLYDSLNLIEIKNIITTNIDNLIPAIFENSNKYYVNSVVYRGPTKNESNAINYIPLHGDVLLPDSKLIFGKFELSSANDQNKGLFSMMHGELLKYPTLFWGYAFHDGSVNNVLNYVLSQGKQDIWVQLLPGNDNIDFFHDLGVNVIVSDTEELLEYIKSNTTEFTANDIQQKRKNEFWNSYKIPSLTNVLAEPRELFFQQGNNNWFFTLTDVAYNTAWVNNVLDISLKSKNTIIVGIPFCGKTTLLQQVALKYPKQVYYVDDLSEEKSKLICNNINNDSEETIILIDNCSEDIMAYKILAENPNIRTIATSDDFSFETSKHLIDGIPYKKIAIDNLNELEAKRAYNVIPSNIRKEPFSYKIDANEKYSFLELISANVKEVISISKIQKILQEIRKQDYDSFELLLLISYLVYFKSSLTTDILFKYYHDTNYAAIQGRITKINSFVSELICPDLIDQDYYSLRSSLFAHYTHIAAQKYYSNEYGNVILKFINEVQPNFIYKYYVFKRKAYDSSLFLQLYGKDADNVYQTIFANDPSAYTLQQWALYKAKTKRYEEAFSDINKALCMLPNNFSIKNSMAIILFEANKEKDYELAKPYLFESMRILEDCYTSDKRKEYHIMKYKDFAIFLKSKYDDNTYIDSAYHWINDLFNSDTTNTRAKKWLEEINKFRST